MQSHMGLCVGGCQQPATDAHHRLARGMGGTSRAAIGQPHNGLPVCEALHLWIEGHLPAARMLGWETAEPDPAEPWWSEAWQCWRVWVQDAGTWLVATTDMHDPDRAAAAAAFTHP